MLEIYSVHNVNYRLLPVVNFGTVAIASLLYFLPNFTYLAIVILQLQNDKKYL